MKKYICIKDANTGMTEISNVCIVLADSKENAQTKASEAFWDTKKYSKEIDVFDLEECKDGWLYYM